MEDIRISNALAAYLSIHETIMEEYRNLKKGISIFPLEMTSLPG